MFGSYISDDYYFYLDSEIGIGLEKTSNIFTGGEFVCVNNKGAGLIKMKLYIQIVPKGTYGETEIKVDYKNKICCLTFSREHVYEWFINPTEFIRENGPNWRYGSANVYIKTELSRNHNDFRNMVIGHIHQANEQR